MKIETVGDLKQALDLFGDFTRVLATSASICTPIGDLYLAADGTLLIDVDADPGGQYKEFFQRGRLQPSKRMEPPLKEREVFPR